MPELNPLSNEQIFLKKIAENTGSNYNTGDVSEINPLTIDQILLKEIAANTAGQSGDISELEEKVSANASAIEAMVNVNGACNRIPRGVSTSSAGVTFTVNADNSITLTGENNTANPAYFAILMSAEAAEYMFTNFETAKTGVFAWLRDINGNQIANSTDTGSGAKVQCPNGVGIYMLEVQSGVSFSTPITVYPMLYDARLNPTGYVQGAMTNKQLTERVTQSEFVSVPTDGVKTQKQLMQDLYALVDPSKISMQSKLVLNNANSLSFYPLNEQALDNRFICFMRTAVSSASGEVIETYQLGVNTAYAGKAYGGVEHETSSEVLSAGMSFTVYY